MFYNFYEEINAYLFYMSSIQNDSLKCIKHYLYNFLKQIFIQNNVYPFY